MDAFEKTMCRGDLNLKVPQRRDLQEFATSVQLTLQMNIWGKSVWIYPHLPYKKGRLVDIYVLEHIY